MGHHPLQCKAVLNHAYYFTKCNDDFVQDDDSNYDFCFLFVATFDQVQKQSKMVNTCSYDWFDTQAKSDYSHANSNQEFNVLFVETFAHNLMSLDDEAKERATIMNNIKTTRLGYIYDPIFVFKKKENA